MFILYNYIYEYICNSINIYIYLYPFGGFTKVVKPSPQQSSVATTRPAVGAA